MASAEELRKRWDTQEGRGRLGAIIDAAKKGRNWVRLLKDFPFVNEVSGGRDLRHAELHSGEIRYPCSGLWCGPASDLRDVDLLTPV